MQILNIKCIVACYYTVIDVHVPLSTINASGLKLIDIGFDGIPLTAGEVQYMT
jgi:hypothetical protein